MRLPPTRRGALGALAAFAGWPALAAPPSPASLAFKALRNGQLIGEQTMQFARQAGVLTVHTLAEFLVKLGPIPVYRYRHEATERWVGGVFAEIATRTDQNGRLRRVSAARDASGRVRVSPAQGAPYLAPASALPFTHWNPQIASATLFNPQDGQLLHERAQPPTASTVMLASGRTAPASRIVFQGEAYIEDYYDAQAVWTGLVGKLTDGSRLEYRRIG